MVGGLLKVKLCEFKTGTTPEPLRRYEPAKLVGSAPHRNPKEPELSSLGFRRTNARSLDRDSGKLEAHRILLIRTAKALGSSCDLK